MLLQDYNPNSIKLFSKCARSQASKASLQRRPASSKPRSTMLDMSEHSKMKKTVCTFDMTESRQQRERKHRKTETPAVGQYNPRTQSRCKFTWDILKIYQAKNARVRDRIARVEAKKNQAKDEGKGKVEGEIEKDGLGNGEGEGEGEGNLEGKQEEKMEDDRKEDLKEVLLKLDENSMTNKTLAKRSSKLLMSPTSRYKSIKSQVDMSRMTGRNQQKPETQIDQSIDFDLNKSLSYIKSKPSLTIQFSTQLSRQQISNLHRQQIGPDYNYNYQLIKPKSSTIAQFGKSVGRDDDEQKKKKKISLAYSYTHYDFDRYVWGAKSNVYVNTKTHLTDFRKQTNRVLFRR